jgi:hypothetical protein
MINTLLRAQNIQNFVTNPASLHRNTNTYVQSIPLSSNHKNAFPLGINVLQTPV